MTSKIRFVIFLFLTIFFACRSSEKKKAESRQNVIDSSGTRDLKDTSITAGRPVPRTDDSTVTLGKIVFPNFDFKIKDFQIDYGLNGVDIDHPAVEKLAFDNDSHLNITPKTDSIPLPMEDTLANRLIEIIPHEKNDRFKISYCYLYTVEYEKNGAVYISDATSYKPLKDSANFFFRIPLFAHASPLNEIKARIKVTDSVVKTTTGDYGEEKYTVYKVKDKLLIISELNICFKIERFQNNNLKETKFVWFYDVDLD